MKAIPLLILSVALPLQAQFLTPPWQGSTNSEYAEWDLFTEASVTPNLPDIATDTPTNDAVIISSTSSAFITGSKNIYSFLSALSLQLDDSASYPIANVLLQLFSQGSELDLTTVRLVPSDATSTADIIYPTKAVLLDQNTLTGPNGGLGSAYVVQWNLSAAPLAVSYSILFESEESSMSLDKAYLSTSDTFQEIVIPTVPPEAPVAEINGGNIILSWPLDGGEQLVLEQCHNLTNSNNWNKAIGTPIQTATHYELALPLGHEPAFFRLAKQEGAQ